MDFPRTTITVAGTQPVRLRVIDVGPAELPTRGTIVCIHGAGGNAEQWKNQIAYFSQHYRVIAPDLRGHDQSEQPRSSYTLEEFLWDFTQTLDQLKGCLAAGYPIVFGFSVYESFETQAVAKTGKVPMPKSKEKQLGGHAVLAVGYDDASKRFIVRNSWGTGWGLQGYFTIPYDYLTDGNLADDFWTIKQV